MPERPRYDLSSSLLRQLLGDHLDAGYAAAHRRRAGRPVPWLAQRVWFAVGALLLGSLLGVAATNAAARQPGAEETKRGLVAGVRAERADTEALARRAAALAKQLDEARTAALAGDGQGRAVLDQLTRLERATAAVPVTGPGLRVTVGDPPERRRTRSRENILDRDLQVLVNSLWASGAEAVAVGGHRLQPRAAVRQAGGMLVDNRPVTQPYVLEAIGNPEELETRFVGTDGHGRFTTFAQLYGTTFTVERVPELRLAGAPADEPRLAVAPAAPIAPPTTPGR
ncbi:DUF881 domain-containing protein [Allokutzneria albata]|uniref:Uncharacterized conserved protein YlxW, UPF0749 family n=1 Tax=Allokutzneria albata TaxID=211114 RepID=A0A1G9VEW1_ALLAB|nr:DUF881 domain-containing protein [Allokutzneria albata]SDM70640.1 Uncharacterized conserved protein YlxW, UPF0749 family [Allokutzneria albata]